MCGSTARRIPFNGNFRFILQQQQTTRRDRRRSAAFAKLIRERLSAFIEISRLELIM